MENVCVLHIEKIHTFSQLHALQKHNNREIPLPNVDKNKSYENKILFSSCSGSAYTDAWREIVRMAEVKNSKKIKTRKNAVLALDILTSYSKDSNVNVEIWAAKNVEWFKKTFGEENIISCTLHMDETTPHIHAEIVPIVEGRLCAKALTAGRKAMSDMQTSYGKAMEECGLTRGHKASKSKKKDLKKFYKSVDKAISAKLPPQMKGEEDQEYLVRMEEYCQAMKLAMEKLKIEAEEANAITNSRIAEEFSKFSDAVSFYEDLYEKYNEDKEVVSDRITLYRRIENMMPKKDLDTLIKNIIERYKANETPLVNWARYGNHAYEKKQRKDSLRIKEEQQNLFKDDFDMYKNSEFDDE